MMIDFSIYVTILQISFMNVVHEFVNIVHMNSFSAKFVNFGSHGS